MRNYNFYEKLSWEEFQDLACEVVQQREGVAIQTFSSGADDGIDGLWFNKETSIIVQAKRYKEFDALFKTLKNNELAKVEKMKPERYILVVSLGLTKSQSDKIYALFKKYILNSTGVYEILDSFMNKVEAFCNSRVS